MKLVQQRKGARKKKNYWDTRKKLGMLVGGLFWADLQFDSAHIF